MASLAAIEAPKGAWAHVFLCESDRCRLVALLAPGERLMARARAGEYFRLKTLSGDAAVIPGDY